ncbi:hypothetical protein GWI33_007511 [Rhynchophorus ferrugineus]|uniref:Uncharacterized protein n=1 Tax=Rhynchophorus ferrugineus TaxID=354439 RepID=A0A834IG53_RHYFE|nr:hypothetical protein GWI33_007511 [Rhynchophorus ferrugineus]
MGDDPSEIEGEPTDRVRTASSQIKLARCHKLIPWGDPLPDYGGPDKPDVSTIYTKFKIIPIAHHPPKIAIPILQPPPGAFATPRNPPSRPPTCRAAPLHPQINLIGNVNFN